MEHERGVAAAAGRPLAGRAGAGGGEGEVSAALVARLERIVVLAERRRQGGEHGELLEELRGLLSEAVGATAEDEREEVVERPARRLHGT